MSMLDYRSVTSLAFLCFFGCILKDSETPKERSKSTNMSVMVSLKSFRKSGWKKLDSSFAFRSFWVWVIVNLLFF